MKKFIKIAMIVAACFMFLAIFFVGVGFAMGGSNITNELAQGMSKSLFNMDKFHWNDATALDEAEDIGEITFDDWTDSSIIIYDGNLEQTEIASKDEIHNIVCKIAACEFNILESNDNMFRIESTTFGQFRCYQEGNTIYFEGVNDRRLLKNVTGSITLYIPKEMELDRLELHAGACDLYIESIQAKDVEIEIGAGKVQIDDIMASDTIINLGAGEMIIDSMTTDTYLAQIGAGEILTRELLADYVELNVGAGNATFRKMKANKISVTCAMGNIEMMIDGVETEYSYSAKCIAGNVEIGRNGGMILGVATHEGTSSDKKIIADCAMGNIEILFQE